MTNTEKVYMSVFYMWMCVALAFILHGTPLQGVPIILWVISALYGLHVCINITKGEK